MQDPGNSNDSEQAQESDKLQLAHEDLAETPKPVPANTKTWKILVVDDEQEVHAITGLVLDDFEFANRPLELINAYSGAEAKKLMAENSDIAVILLDVVMETDQAGLDVARYIREDLKNPFTRIVLRTGQPGQAPEHKVITDYDINDYKEKTELTRQKLFTTIYTSLSSYRDLIALDGNRRGLIKVIEASAEIFELRSIQYFAEGVLEQLTALLYLGQDAMVIATAGLAADLTDGEYSIVAATGCFRPLVGESLCSGLNESVLQRVRNSLKNKESHFGTDYYVGYYQTDSGIDHILYVSANAEISVPDKNLIELFAHNVAIAHENARLLSEHNESR